jgi:hypothetical protein
MTMKSPPVWQDALALVSVRLVLAQLGLVAGVFGFFLLWLRMPDASILELAGSGLLVVLVVSAAGLGESRLILRLAGRPLKLSSFVRGALLMFVGVALWFVWSAWFAHVSSNDPMRAGYLNSRVPHQLRNLLSFEHILLWLGWMWSTIKWLGGGLLATLIFPLVAGGRPIRATLIIVRSASFWFTLLVGTTVATLFTGALMEWMPRWNLLRGLWVEMFSLGLRLTVVALFDGIVACWLLATLAVCVRRADSGYATSAGGPDDSQPRIVETP